MTAAIYAFSGDPITNGHVNIIERASKAFVTVIAAIGVNPNKGYTFSRTERTEMAKAALAHLPNVTVDSFDGLLVDYAYTNNISIIIRGVRNVRDMIDENELFYINLSQNRNIDTFFIPSSSNTFHISSSAAKALQKEQGIIRDYVPLSVKQKLEQRISGQNIIGITGNIGCGKSFVGAELVKYASQKNQEAHNIEMDDIGKKILEDTTSPLGSRINDEVLKEFSHEDCVYRDGPFIVLDRKKLGDIVFNDQNKLKKLNEILHEPILNELRKQIYGKRGLIFINAALIAEAGLSYICNNNVIIVHSDCQMEALEKRGLTADQIQSRLNCQYTNEKKGDVIQAEIDRTGVGNIIQYLNQRDNIQSIKILYESIMQDNY